MKTLLALLLLAICAHADYAETEHRLKQAGVDKALRRRIHTAVDKAVAYLTAKQRKGGSWSSQRSLQWKLWHPREAETVFASLALRHAGWRRRHGRFRRARVPGQSRREDTAPYFSARNRADRRTRHPPRPPHLGDRRRSCS